MAMTEAQRTIAERISRSGHWSLKQLTAFRRVRRQVLSQYAGAHWGDENPTDRVPYNLIGMMLDVYRQRLASGLPRFLVHTNVAELLPESKDIEAALNTVAKRIKLHDAWDRVFVDAMCAPFGVMKVGVASTPGVAEDDADLDPGELYAQPVDFDDFVIDMAAEHVNAADYIGNRYRVRMYELMESGRFDRDALDKLYKSHSSKDDIDEFGEERAATLGRETKQDDSELHDYATLWEFWVPMPRGSDLIVTLCGDELETAQHVLEVREFTGTENGPYRMCSFTEMPGSPLGIPPLTQVYDLHMALNQTLRKILRQMARQKTVIGVGHGGEDDVQRLRRADDGDAVTITQPGGTSEIRFGGADPANVALFLQLRQVASQVAGNLDVIGGMGSNAETLGQEEILSGNASQRLVAMERRSREFLASIGEELGWYLLTDPSLDLRTTRRIPGVNRDVPVHLTADKLLGNPFLYDFNVAAYSLADEGPSAKMRAIDAWMERMLPFMPMMEQQGIGLDLRGLSDEIGRLTSNTSLGEFVITQTPPDDRVADQEPRGSVPSAGMPPVTRRINERISRSAPTAKGQAQDLANQMLGQAFKANAQSGKGTY